VAVSLVALSPYLNPLDWTTKDWDEIREWLIALGTVGAVIVALFIAGWQARRIDRRRPVLSLSLDDAFGLTKETVAYLDSNGEVNATSPAYYLRLSVTNENGKDAASAVELFPAQYREQSADAADAPTFASFPPFAWTHLSRAVVDVPAGVTRLIDLARFALSPSVYAPKDTLELLVTPQPNDQRHLLAPGDHFLALTLSAHNTDARYYMLIVTFDPATTPPVVVRGPIPVAWTFATPAAFMPA
jgi:hypothetical protein